MADKTLTQKLQDTESKENKTLQKMLGYGPNYIARTELEILSWQIREKMDEMGLMDKFWDEVTITWINAGLTVYQER